MKASSDCHDLGVTVLYHHSTWLCRFDIFCSEIKTFLLCHPNHLRNLLLCRRQCRGRALPMAAVLSFDALFTHLHHRFIETAVNCPGLVESDRRTLLHHNCRVLVSLGHSIHVPVNGVNAIAVGKVGDHLGAAQLVACGSSPASFFEGLSLTRAVELLTSFMMRPEVSVTSSFSSMVSLPRWWNSSRGTLLKTASSRDC